MTDVARLAGVSQMTVSRALSDSSYVSDDVRQRVADAADQLGYIPNRLASIQAGVESPMVGVILPTLKNRVFPEVLAGINDTLALHNIRPLFGVSEYAEAEEEKLVRDLLAWQPRGLILAGLEHSQEARRLITQTQVRVVEIMDIDGVPMTASCGISHQKAGADMAKHFVERGYRRIAYLGSQGDTDLRATKRFEAFTRTLREGGAQLVHQHVARDASSMLLGRELTAACLAGASAPDAVYFSNDDLAAGGLMHCLAEGIAVPDTLALAGFNGLSFLDALPLKITTTTTPRYEMGVRAAECVAGIRELASGAHEMPAQLIVGDTS